MKILFLDFIQALRSMRKHGWQSLLSVAGIAVGTACLALTTDWLWRENNYDSFRQDYRNMYAVQADSTVFGPSTTLPYAMQPQLDSLLGGRIPYAITRNADNNIGASAERGGMFEKTILEASPGTGEALNIKVLRGSLSSALEGEGSIALTEHMAELLFGSDDALGRSVFVGNPYAEPQEFTVSAILENCGQSNIYYDALKGIEKQDWFDHWGSNNFHIIVNTPDSAEALRLLNKIEQPKEYRTTYSLRPLRTLHQSSGGEGGEDFVDKNFYAIAFCFIAALLLIAAVVNLITIFTSIFLGRTREYALRRSLGARRRQNVRWICTSVVPPVIVAIALGLAGLIIVLHFNPVLGAGASLYRFFAEIAVVTFAACLAGMLYPVWKLERAYRRSLGYGVAGRKRSHGWLFIVQSFVCALLLFISIGMQRQLYSMMNGDLGFDRENILRIHTGRGWHPTLWNRDTQTQDVKATEDFSFRDIFWNIPAEIKAESAAVDDAIAMPFDIFNRNTGVSFTLIPDSMNNDAKEYDYYMAHFDGNHEELERQLVRYIEIPYAAFDFFKIKADGNPLRQQDEQEGMLNVLMNDEARQRFHIEKNGLSGLRSGQSIQTMNSMTSGTDKHMVKQRLNVSGTFHIALNDFHNETEPLIMTGIPERHECLFVNHDAIYVRYQPGRRAEAEAAIHNVLDRHEVPEANRYVETISDYIAYSYSEETFYARLISALSVLSIVITLSGVVSLLLYALRMRRRSIAIRRLHGAGFSRLLCSQLVPFAAYTAAGAIPAFFPAWLFMRRWMEFFHHGSAPGLGLMAAILAAMLLTVALIVCLQVKLAMLTRPVEVLKPEA